MALFFQIPKPRTLSLSKPPSTRERLSQSASKRKIPLPQNWVRFSKRPHFAPRGFEPQKPLLATTPPPIGFVFETLLRPSHLASKRKPPFAHPQARKWVRFSRGT